MLVNAGRWFVIQVCLLLHVPLLHCPQSSPWEGVTSFEGFSVTSLLTGFSVCCVALGFLLFLYFYPKFQSLWVQAQYLCSTWSFQIHWVRVWSRESEFLLGRVLELEWWAPEYVCSGVLVPREGLKGCMSTQVEQQEGPSSIPWMSELFSWSLLCVSKHLQGRLWGLPQAEWKIKKWIDNLLESFCNVHTDHLYSIVIQWWFINLKNDLTHVYICGLLIKRIFDHCW